MGINTLGRQSASCQLSTQWKHLHWKAFTSQTLISLSMCVKSPVPSFLVVFKTLISRMLVLRYASLDRLLFGLCFHQNVVP